MSVNRKAEAEAYLLRAAKELPRKNVKAHFSSHAVIRLEDGTKVHGPKPNILQNRVFEHYELCQKENRGCMIIILKPRRKGASTGSQDVMYCHAQRHKGVNGTIMADKDGTSDEIYEIFRTIAEEDTFEWHPDEEYSALPARGKPGNTDEDIELPCGSKYGKETAGSSNAGRGGTRQYLNLTECAWYTGKEKDPTLALLPSCEVAMRQDTNRGVIIADSTPNGPKGWFYKTCMLAKKGQGDWKLIFAAWYEFENSVRMFSSHEERQAFIDSIDDPENAWLEERRELRLYGGGEHNFEKITPEHLYWRRQTIFTFCDGSVTKFRQEYPSDPDECFQASAEKRFNEFHTKRCRDMMPSNLPTRYSMNYMEADRMVSVYPDPKGEVLVYEQPKYGCKYLASGDFCTGADQQVGGRESDPDWHSLKIWRDGYFDPSSRRWVNAKMVCSYRSRVDIDLAAHQLAAMSQYYGRCFVLTEVNNCGLEPTHILRDLGFSLYERTGRDPTTNQKKQALGWNTNEVTRKTIVDHFAKLWREGKLDTFDKTDLEEIDNFVTNKAGRPEALEGKHDDTVLSNCMNVFNLSTMGTIYRGPKRKGYTLEQLMSDPTLMVPDGYRRGGLGDNMKRSRKGRLRYRR